MFVVFFYDIFPDGLKLMESMGVRLHALATWWDVLECARNRRLFGEDTLAEAERFMRDPRGWSLAHGGTAGAGAE